MMATWRPRTLGAWMLLTVAGCSTAAAQDSGARCCASFDFVLERTIFKVDAVRLELEVQGDLPDRIAAFLATHGDRRAAADSVAALYLAADRVEVRMTFLRSFSLRRFLDADRDVMEKLNAVGWISDEERLQLEAENADRFQVLEADGIRHGDRLEHQVRGDTVTTLYTDVTGNVRIDEVRVGSEQRRMLLGSLFGAGAAFRNGLLDLVFRRAAADPP
ncbi:MAG: hypothetical protein Q8W45_00555 [Candidatus Palauibacterales bacterium]|nr:hypothetical protein [Candidatus Palauibacterales bacterium]